MNPTLEQIKKEINNLPLDERFLLLQELARTINPSAFQVEFPGKTEEEWGQLVAARIAEVRGRSVRLISGHEAENRTAAFMVTLNDYLPAR